MEQAFRNLEEFFEAQGAFGEDQLDDHLWIDPAEADRLRERGLAFFVDSRDTPDYDVSHVKDAHSLPGHTTGQLEGMLQHPVVLTLARSPASIVIVYSDNGSKLSRCVNVSRILRHVLAPERVRRLKTGLNGWKKEALPVNGDPRLFFAGKPMAPAHLLENALPEVGSMSITNQQRIARAFMHNPGGVPEAHEVLGDI